MKITNNFFIKTTLLMLILAISSCSFLGDFSRGKAADLIQKDKRYPSPSSMTIDVRGRLTNAEGKTWQISKDDTAEAAAVRAREDFMTRQPQIIVAEELGFIKLNFEEPELSEKEMGMPYELSRQNMGVWYFKVQAEITAKGRQLWKDSNLDANEKELPLAVRSNPDITGIADENQNMKKVDFEYKWKPTELGEAFDPSSSAYAKLPKNLQEALNKVQANMFGGSSNNLADFKSVRKGVAHFRKFDDGWRVSEVMFF